MQIFRLQLTNVLIEQISVCKEATEVIELNSLSSFRSV